MRALLIAIALAVLAIAATTEGGTVSIERPFELAFYVTALLVLIIGATPSEKRLRKELHRRRQGKEATDANARRESSSVHRQVFDWSRLADHQPDRSDRANRAR